MTQNLVNFAQKRLRTIDEFFPTSIHPKLHIARHCQPYHMDVM